MALLTCPICRSRFRAEDSPAMPFCSERCRLVDLHRWLNESYGIPVEPEEPRDDEDAPSEPSC